MRKPKRFGIHRATIGEYHNIMGPLIQGSLEVTVIELDMLLLFGRLEDGTVLLGHWVRSVDAADIVGAYSAVVGRDVVQQRLDIVG